MAVKNRRTRGASGPVRRQQSLLVRWVTNPWAFFGVCFPVLVAIQNFGQLNEGDDAPREHNPRFTSEWAQGFYADSDAPLPKGTVRHLKIYPNGGDGPAEDVVISTEGDFRRLGRLYNDRGQIVLRSNQAVNGSALFRGPTQAGTHFQWPGVQVGRRVSVPGVTSPTELPIELETLTMGRPGEPRVFYVHNFLSKEETEHLISFATDDANPYKMAPSTAATHHSWSEGGRKATSSQRTSENAFDMMTPTSFAIKRRAFRLLRLDSYVEEMSDGIQILRYELGQAYISHHDWFPTGQSTDHNWDPQRGGSNRWATLFLYLSDVDHGGQTVFPKSPRLKNESNPELVGRLGTPPSARKKRELVKKAHLRENSWEVDLIDKCYTRFAVPPRRGDAILFYSQRPDGQLDEASLHGACPVLAGTKWAANLWVWNACRFNQCRHDPLNPAKELPDQLRADVETLP